MTTTDTSFVETETNTEKIAGSTRAKKDPFSHDWYRQRSAEYSRFGFPIMPDLDFLTPTSISIPSYPYASDDCEEATSGAYLRPKYQRDQGIRYLNSFLGK